MHTGVLATLGLALAFLYWIGYYERVGAQHELHVRNALEARRLRRWAYGHIPLLVGVAGGGAGLIAATGSASGTAASWLMALCITGAMVGLTLIGEARRVATGAGPSRRNLHLVLALLPMMLAPSGVMAWALASGVATAAAQIALSRWNAP
ncbi:MAG: hypothetical protein Fur0019_14180 [Tibeticola sp.]